MVPVARDFGSPGPHSSSSVGVLFNFSELCILFINFLSYLKRKSTKEEGKMKYIMKFYKMNMLKK